MKALILLTLFPVFVSAQNMTINGAGTTTTLNGGGDNAGITSFATSSRDNHFNTLQNGRQLIVIVGNSIARGTSEADGPTPDAGTVWEYNGSSIVTVGSGDLAAAGVGSAWPKEGIDYFSLTAKRTIFVNSAVSGAYYSSTSGDGGANWSTTGTLYSAMTTKVNNGLAAAGITRPRAIFVELGINDARSSVALSQVETDVISLFDRLQTDFPNTTIYVTNIGRHQTAISDARIDAIRGYIANEIGGNVKLAYDLRIFANDFPSYYSGDLIHLNQTGNNAWGAILATYLSTN